MNPLSGYYFLSIERSVGSESNSVEDSCSDRVVVGAGSGCRIEVSRAGQLSCVESDGEGVLTRLRVDECRLP